MKVRKDFVLRETAGEYMIIPTGRTVQSFDGLITVNEVGADLWNMLQSEVTFDDLLKGILETYDVDEETAREDIPHASQARSAARWDAHSARLARWGS